MKTYQVTQKLAWCNPGMLVFVNEYGMVVGHQQNPKNGLTQHWVEDDEDLAPFNPEDYEKCELVTG